MTPGLVQVSMGVWLILASLAEHADAKSNSAAKRIDDLPEVATLLRRASRNMGDFSMQARAMQERVEEKQKATRAMLTAHKTAYEKKLSKQEEAGRFLEIANDHLTARIQDLDEVIQNLRVDAENLQSGNSAMRKVLGELVLKIGEEMDFIAESLNIADESSIKENAGAFEAPLPEPSLSNFLKISKGASGLEQEEEEEEDRQVLLELGQRVQAVQKQQQQHQQQQQQQQSEQSMAAAMDGTQEIVKEMQANVEKLDQAEREGEAQLRANFLAMYEAGDQDLDILRKEQGSLNTTLASRESLLNDLRVAKTHLVRNRAALKHRVHALRAFADKANEAVDKVIHQAERAAESGRSALLPPFVAAAEAREA